MDHHNSFFLDLQSSSGTSVATNHQDWVSSQRENQNNSLGTMSNYELNLMLLRQKEEELLKLHQVQSKKRFLDDFSRIRLNSLPRPPTPEEMHFQEQLALRRASLSSMGETYSNNSRHATGYLDTDARARKKEYIMALRQELEREEAALQHATESSSSISPNSFQSQKPIRSTSGHKAGLCHENMTWQQSRSQIRGMPIVRDQRDHQSEQRNTVTSARCTEDPFPQEERDDYSNDTSSSLRPGAGFCESQGLKQSLRTWGDNPRQREADTIVHDCGRRLSRQEAARYGLRSSLDTRKRLKLGSGRTEASTLSTDMTITSARRNVVPPANEKSRQYLSYQEKLDLAWYSKLDELKEYRMKHGHCNVSVHDPDNKQLGMWLSTQRQAYKGKGSGKMTDTRIQVLESLRVEWIVFSPFAPRWDEYFKDLKAFKAKHGHINVPRRQPAYRELGEWLESQRRGYQRFNALGVAKGGLSLIHVQLLEGIGIDWTLSKSD